MKVGLGVFILVTGTLGFQITFCWC